MKATSFFCNYFVILLFTVMSTNIAVAMTTKKETLTKVYDVSPSGSLDLSSSRSNVEILTWEQNEVKIVGELTFEGDGDKEDIDKLLNAFKNMSAESSKDVLSMNLSLVVS